MCSSSWVYQWLYIQTCLNINSLTIKNVIIGFEYFKLIFKTTFIMIVNHNKEHRPQSIYYYSCGVCTMYVLNYFANRKGFIYIENTWVKIHKAYSTIIMDVHCSIWSFLQDFFFKKCLVLVLQMCIFK